MDLQVVDHLHRTLEQRFRDLIGSPQHLNGQRFKDPLKDAEMPVDLWRQTLALILRLLCRTMEELLLNHL